MSVERIKSRGGVTFEIGERLTVVNGDGRLIETLHCVGRKKDKDHKGEHTVYKFDLTHHDNP